MNIAIIAILLAGFVFAGCSTWLVIERDTHTRIERGQAPGDDDADEQQPQEEEDGTR